jgi:hypothetical protein
VPQVLAVDHGDFETRFQKLAQMAFCAQIGRHTPQNNLAAAVLAQL